MSLSVLILGSGSALPTISANQTAQLVRCGEQSFLMDCGEGTQIELRRNKVKMQKIDQVFISHLHGDHFFGLVGLLSTMHLLGRTKELQVFGPKGLQEIVEIQFKNAGSHLSFEMQFYEVTEGGKVVYENSKIVISSIPLKHRIPCYGFLFQEKPGLRKLKASALAKYKVPVYARKALTEGEDFITEEGKVIENTKITSDPETPKSYAFCSDTAYYEKIIPYIKGVDLLYHEATFLSNEEARAKKTFHSTAAQAATIAKEAGASQMIIGHFSNRYKEKELFLEEARPVFAETYLAEEGQEYTI